MDATAFECVPVEIVTLILDFTRKKSILCVCRLWREIALSLAWGQQMRAMCTLAEMPRVVFARVMRHIASRAFSLPEADIARVCARHRIPVEFEKPERMSQYHVCIGRRGGRYYGFLSVDYEYYRIRVLEESPTAVFCHCGCRLPFGGLFTCTKCGRNPSLAPVLKEMITALRQFYMQPAVKK